MAKWRDLDQQERDWVCSLMPQSISQSDGVLYANSRRCTEKSCVTYYKCKACRAASVGTLLKGSSEPTVRLVRPHSCSTESSPEQPLVVVDYTEEMRTVASERAYSQLSKSARTLALEVYDEFDRRGNSEGALMHMCNNNTIHYIYMPYVAITLFWLRHVGHDRRLVSLEKLENLVRASRRKDFGDWESQLFTPALCRVGGDDDRNFVRLNVKTIIGGELVQVSIIYLFISLSAYSPSRSLLIAVGIRPSRSSTRAWRLRPTRVCRRHVCSGAIRILPAFGNDELVQLLRHVCTGVLHSYVGMLMLTAC